MKILTSNPVLVKGSGVKIREKDNLKRSNKVSKFSFENTSFIKMNDLNYIVYPTGEVFGDFISAINHIVEIYKVKDRTFFSRFYKTIRYLVNRLSKDEIYILGTLLANYNFRIHFERHKVSKSKALREWTPPKKIQPLWGKPFQVLGLEQMVFERLSEIGANAHCKTISRCSTASMLLYDEKQEKVASYNMPCRKPTCVYCSHLVDKESNHPLLRSQAITEKGKKHLRYAFIGGDVKFYGRMIFTFPKEIQNLVDRKDIINYEDYGSVEVYGSYLEREIEILKNERIQIKKNFQESEERSKKINSLKNKIAYKKKIVREFKEIGKRIRLLESKQRKFKKTKPLNWERKVACIKSELKPLRKSFKKMRQKMEKGRIMLNDIQRAPYEFLSEHLGIKALIDTPHLTGEGSQLRGDFHLHFHSLFPLFGDEFGFNWDKKQPFIPKEELKSLNEKWKSFLEFRFNLKIESKLANPQYNYISADGEKEEDIKTLAFWIRYDHRIEAGGAWFPLFASDEDVCRVLRMTTRQRYTRGYGMWSDRNLKDFEEATDGISLKDMLVKCDDPDVKKVEGEWKVLSIDKLSEDVPFSGNIENYSLDGFESEMLKQGKENLSINVENDNEKPVFAKYVQHELAKSIEETAFEICYFHEDFNVWSTWSKRKKRIFANEDGLKVVKYVDSFEFQKVYFKLPDIAEEEGNGFFMWNSGIQKIREDVVNRMEHSYSKGAVRSCQ